MADNLVEIRGLSFMDGKVVMVGKATQEKDHGNPCWLCSTFPPHVQRFEMVTYQQEAIAWLRREAGAEEIFLGTVVE